MNRAWPPAQQDMTPPPEPTGGGSIAERHGAAGHDRANRHGDPIGRLAGLMSGNGSAKAGMAEPARTKVRWRITSKWPSNLDLKTMMQVQQRDVKSDREAAPTPRPR